MTQCASGQYVNVYMDPPLYDVVVLFNEGNGVLEDSDLSRALDLVESIVERAWKENRSEKEVRNEIESELDKLEYLSYGVQVVLKWRIDLKCK